MEFSARFSDIISWGNQWQKCRLFSQTKIQSKITKVDYYFWMPKHFLAFLKDSRNKSQATAQPLVVLTVNIPQLWVTYTKREIDFFHRVFYDPKGSKRPFPKTLRCENKPPPQFCLIVGQLQHKSTLIRKKTLKLFSALLCSVYSFTSQPSNQT